MLKCFFRGTHSILSRIEAYAVSRRLLYAFLSERVLCTCAFKILLYVEQGGEVAVQLRQLKRVLPGRLLMCSRLKSGSWQEMSRLEDESCERGLLVDAHAPVTRGSHDKPLILSSARVCQFALLRIRFSCGPCDGQWTHEAFSPVPRSCARVETAMFLV